MKLLLCSRRRPVPIVLLSLGLWAVLLLGSPDALAKSTRTFTGSNPGEVEKNARKAGYSYPEGAMNCSSRCEQRWAKD